MTAPVRIVVAGRPVTQGSMKSIGKGRMIHSTALVAWRHAVGWAAKSAMVGREPFVKTPLVLGAVFYVERGGSEFDQPIGHQHGDVDKYLRAVCDAIKGIVYDDDSRIVGYIDTPQKQYATRRPGALITVRPWQASDASTAVGAEVG